MQESFQEKRRASALRSNPTWVLRTLALAVLVGVFVALFQSLRKPRSGSASSGGQASPSASALPGVADPSVKSAYAPTDPRADKLEKLVFESFSASGKKGVELEAAGSSGRESERRFLDTVKARIPFMSQGRPATVEIVADHAQHVASRPSALFQGHVKMTTDDGLVLETDELFYDGRDGLAQSERKVIWRRKDISGEALGMLYEGWSDSITFFQDVKIRLRDPDDAPADIEAKAACLSREANTLFLEGDVKIKQGTNRTRSGSLELVFGPDHVIYRAVFRDGFEMVAEGDTATLGFAFPRASGRKTIRGRRLEIAFGAGRAIEEAAAGPEAVMIVDPGPKDLRERREIRADALIFKFGPEGKLKEYLGNSGTSVRFVPLNPRAGDLRTISSTDFSASLDPATGEAETISFVENVVFERKNQKGKGSKAEFSEKTGRMVVSGGVTFDDSLANVSLVSSTLDIDTLTGSFRAWGGVRHTQKGGLPGAPFGAAGSDLLATSRQVLYDAPLKRTQYLDRVVFRAGDDELRALTIETVDTPQGPRITADTDVEVLVGGGALGAGLAARSEKMTYTPQDRSFAFSGSASVRQQDFETKAPEILVGLGPPGAFAVRSLEAKGGLVNLKAKDRTAEGTHLLYTPKDGRVEMAGAPVKLEDQGRRVQGRSVTFYTSGDQVEVVGEEGRTETVLQRKIKQ
ncbi:MAG: LPS export ABC transporter periplasmic protein LptC [Vicinamibacteria bacterium]|nr:LPS export ABC transporter periplasmic protein LptC [Vicinamibacteria bacterium]